MPMHKMNFRVNNDGFLSSLLLINISEEVLNVIVVTKTARQVWSFLEEQLLLATPRISMFINSF